MSWGLRLISLACWVGRLTNVRRSAGAACDAVGTVRPIGAIRDLIIQLTNHKVERSNCMDSYLYIVCECQ